MNAPEAVGSRASAWGEGPVWFKDHLWYVDIEGKALVRLHPDSGVETVWEMDQRIGFALPCESGRWIWGGDHGLYFLNTETGESEWITDPEPDQPENRFNDAGVSPDGRLFAGTIALDKREGQANLYLLKKDLTLKVAFPCVTNSNGIGWSLDGKTCYYIDTPTRQVLRFDYQKRKGKLTQPETLINTNELIDASPDGLCMDAVGHLWVAFCHGGCVMQFDHSTGEVLQRIDVPCRETTSCCFGGPELRDLYITTGIPGSDPEPLAGRVFVVRGLQVAGLPQVSLKD